MGIVAPERRRLSPVRIVREAIAVETSVRSTAANRTAPSMSRGRLPAVMTVANAVCPAVYCRIALTSGGVRPGLCSSSAAAPATVGAAIDVPAQLHKGIESGTAICNCGYSLISRSY